MEARSDAPVFGQAVVHSPLPFQISIRDDTEPYPGRASLLCQLVTKYGCGILSLVKGKTKELYAAAEAPGSRAGECHVSRPGQAPQEAGWPGRCPSFPRLRCDSDRSSYLSRFPSTIVVCRRIFCSPLIFSVCAILISILAAALAIWTIIMIKTVCYENGSGYLTFKNTTIAVPQNQSDVSQWIGVVTKDTTEYNWNAIMANDSRETILRKMCFPVDCNAFDSEGARKTSCPRSLAYQWSRLSSNPGLPLTSLVIASVVLVVSLAVAWLVAPNEKTCHMLSFLTFAPIAVIYIRLIICSSLVPFAKFMYSTSH